MATDTSLASFNQGLPTATSNVSNFLLAMRPLYEQYQTLQANQLNKLLNSSSPSLSMAYPDLTALMDKVNSAYDSYAKSASDYATQRYQNASSLMADQFAKKAAKQGLNAQGTVPGGVSGPQSAWQQEYAKSSAEPMNTNYSNIAAQAALGKANFASGSALQGLYNQVYQQNLQNQYNNNLWKMNLANQYSNGSNPFTQLAAIGASLYRGGSGNDSVFPMSGLAGGTDSSNVNTGASQTVSDYGFPAAYKRASTYSYFPSVASGAYNTGIA